MMDLMDDEEFRDAVNAAALRIEVGEAVQAVYRRLQEQIDRRQPICVLSGRCCRFEEYGHRLFVTTMEMAAFAGEFQRYSKSPQLSDAIGRWDGQGCPFQIGKLCGVHTLRPFGCRVFFCDPTSTEWQNHVYETLHAELKLQHEVLAVPYFYVEWRRALRAMKLVHE